MSVKNILDNFIQNQVHAGANYAYVVWECMYGKNEQVNFRKIYSCYDKEKDAIKAANRLVASNMDSYGARTEIERCREGSVTKVIKSGTSSSDWTCVYIERIFRNYTGKAVSAILHGESTRIGGW